MRSIHTTSIATAITTIPLAVRRRDTRLKSLSYWRLPINTLQTT
jgi:hypothetical protein